MNEEVVIIPFVFITIGGVVAWAIANFSRVRMQEREMLNKERLVAMEKGINLPLLESPHFKWRGSPLRTGLVTFGVGIGLTIFMALSGRMNGIGIGAMVTLAGAGNLLYWHLAGKREWETRLKAEQATSDAYVQYLSAMANKNKSA